MWSAMDQTQKDKDLVSAPQAGATKIQHECRLTMNLFEMSRREDKEKVGLISACCIQAGSE